MKKSKLLFFDHGLFVSFAIKLSKWFDVFYFCPWSNNAFPIANPAFIGDGIPEITRVRDFWRTMPDMDYFFFADIYDGGLQEHLRSLGKKVFGGGRGDELEIYRWKLKSLMRDIKLPVNKCERVIGMKALREYLKEHEDVYVKVSAYRGSCETFHSPSYRLIEPELDDLEKDLGGIKYVLPFIIEHKVEAIIETGYDGYSILGKYPNAALYGIEVKDCAYLGVVTKNEDLPEAVQIVNLQLEQLLEMTKYQMFFSTEIRVEEKTKTPYLIDLTCRLPEPPSCLYQEMYANLDEIVIEGANGILVDPKFTAKYGVCVAINSKSAEEHWTGVYFPDEIKQWVKLHNHCRIDGTDYTILSAEGGMVLGIGDTLLDAIQHCRKNAEQIQGCGLDIKVESLVDGIEAIKKGQKSGIKFGDEELPTIEEILGERE